MRSICTGYSAIGQSLQEMTVLGNVNNLYVAKTKTSIYVTSSRPVRPHTHAKAIIKSNLRKGSLPVGNFETCGKQGC
jgi:hypothetical protein